MDANFQCNNFCDRLEKQCTLRLVSGRLPSTDHKQRLSTQRSQKSLRRKLVPIPPQPSPVVYGGATRSLSIFKQTVTKFTLCGLKKQL